MKTSMTRRGRFGSNPDLEKGLAFAALSIGVFVMLVLVQRPHWANPWLIASIFTFGLWLLGKKPAR
jgi:hypothetical protein